MVNSVQYAFQVTVHGLNLWFDLQVGTKSEVMPLYRAFSRARYSSCKSWRVVRRERKETVEYEHYEHYGEQRD